MSRRVVITGLGTINGLGKDVDSYWNGLINGESAVEKVSHFDVSEYSTQIAAPIKGDIDYGNLLDKKEIRRTSRFILHAIYAANQAINDSGLDISANPEMVGVEIGSGIGGIEILEQATLTLHQRGPGKLSPFTVPMMIPDMAAGLVAIKLGAKGPNSCTVTACASANNAIGSAFKTIRDGEAVAMITGGTEACITPLGLASFCAARSLSQRNNDPQGASRPFDAERSGFVMGEGAGILILEEYEHAKARGANIYAELAGYGFSGDAYHITAPAPEGEGGARAMKAALDYAKVNPEDVDYINAHGTSTVLNDKNETAAMKTVLGEKAYDVNISSTKSMTGHLLGAAGAIEAIACIKSINESIIPPTINLENPDPECDLNYTPLKAIEKKVDITFSSVFGFGGHNAVLVFKKIK